MTAQELYITGVLESFSTFCARNRVADPVFQKAQLILVSLLTKLSSKGVDLATIEQSLASLEGSSQESLAAKQLVIQFVKTFPPLQTAVFLRQYLLAVASNGCSQSTIKNYRSDINQFFVFSQNSALEKILVKPKVLAFLRNEQVAGASSATLKRKLSSLTQFGLWLSTVGVLSSGALKWLSELNANPRFESEVAKVDAASLVSTKPKSLEEKSHLLGISTLLPKAQSKHTPATTSGLLSGIKLPGTKHQEHAHRLKTGLQELHQKLNQKTNQWLFSYLNIALLALFVIGLSYFGYMQFFVEAPATQAYPSSLTRPNRTLSFQGRLTDSAQNPITSATNFRFRLYDSGPSTSGGTLLWDSGSCSVTPDQDGIFSTGLGDDCGTEISSDVFSENANVWLQVEVAGETLSPRQSIKSVAYALNSETLQGYPPADPATANTVLVMNSSGEVVLGTTTPKIRSTGTSLTLEGAALALQTTSNGNITLNPQGTGNVISSRYIYAPGATLSATYAGGTALVTRGGPSGTANIQEWQNNAGSALSIVNSAGNLGIGTTSTRAALDVNGDASASGSLVLRGSSPSTIDVLNGSRLDIQTSPGGDAGLTPRLTILPSGSVGIGSTAPTQALDIAGGGVKLVNGNSLMWGTNTNYSIYGHASTGYLRLRTAGTDRLAIDAAGNIGIGTTTPTSFKLEVAGNIGPTATATYNLGSSAKRWNDIYGTTIYGTTIYQNGNQVCDSSGNCPGSGLWQNTDNVFHPKNEYAGIADLVIGGNSTASADFQVIGSGANAGYVYGRRFTDIDANGYYVEPGNTTYSALFAGNVGIGTTAPGQQLSLVNGGASDLELGLDNGTAQAVFEIQTNNVARMGTTSNNSFEFVTNNTSRIKVMNGGNVGVGTTSPTALLDVAGDASSSGSLVFRGSSPSTIDVLNGNRLDLQTSPGGDAGLTPKVSVLGNGNVGVGTTAPAARFEVSANASGAFLLNRSGGAISSMEFRNGAGSMYAGIDNDADFAIRNLADIDTSNYFIIKNATGNVGIGTATPSQKLHVQGNARITGALYDSSNSAGNSGYIFLSTGSGTAWTDPSTLFDIGYWDLTANVLHPRAEYAGIADLVIGGDSTASADFQVIGSGANAGYVYGRRFLDVDATSYYVEPGNSTYSALFASNVGIGTTSPGAKLDVLGNINISNGNSLILQRGAGTNRDISFTTASAYDNIGQMFIYPPSGTNVKASIAISPKGTGFSSNNMAEISVYNTDAVADTTNTEFVAIRAIGTNGYVIGSGKTNSGSNRDISLAAGWMTNGITNYGQLHLSTSGNVGIGTTTATQALDVNGDLRVRGNDIADSANTNRISLGATTTLTNTTTTLSGTTTLTASSLATMTTSSSVNWGGATTLTFTADNATINGSDAANGNLTLQGTSSGTKTTSYVNIQPTGGNVGIGTTTPLDVLHVNGNLRTNANSINGGVYGYSGSSGTGNHIFSLTRQNTPASGSVALSAYDALGFTAGATGGPSTSYQMLLSTTGNLGIGTTTPLGRLQVTGDEVRIGAAGTLNFATGDGDLYVQDTLEVDGTIYQNGQQVCDESGNCNTSGLWENSSNAFHPRNEWASVADVIIGSDATSSAKFGFINVASGTPTATISGNLAIASPTGSGAATTYNVLNGGSFNLRTSVGGDVGLTSRLFVSNDGLIGMGTASPTQTLDINGDLRVRGNDITDSGDNTRITLGSNTTLTNTTTTLSGTTTLTASSLATMTTSSSVNWGGATSLTFTADNATIYGSDATNGNLTLQGTSSGTKTSSYVLLQPSGGSVGIGNSSPGYLLDVSGDIRSTGSVRTSNLITNTGDLAISASGWGMTFSIDTDNNSANSYIFEGNGAEVARLTDTGNLGIGTSNPTQKLHIQGDARITGALYDSSNSPGSANYLLVSTGSGTSWTNPESLLDLGWWDLTANVIHPRGAYAGIADLVVGGDSTASADFQVIGSGANAGYTYGRRFIDVDSTNYFVEPGNTTQAGVFAGNVGIGTTSTPDKLVVAGNISLGSNALKFSNFNVADSGGTSLTFTHSGTGGNEFQVVSDGADYANTYAQVGSNARIHSNGFSYLNGGNVGIGTTGPTQALDVNGDLRVRGNDIADSANTNRISLGATTTLTNTTTTLSGTTTLTASSLATMTTSSSVNWGGATSLTFTSDNATINGSDAANGNLTLQGTSSGTKTSSYVNIQPTGGNVGIGTTVPSALLNVYKADTATLKVESASSGTPARRSIIELASGDANRARGILTSAGGTEEWFFGAPYGSTGFTIGYGASQAEYTAQSKLFIATGGNIGIGTTNPLGKLQITGDEVRIGAAGTINNATGDGDLYVEDALEVDGTIYGASILQNGNQVCDESGNCTTNGLWKNSSNVFHPRDQWAGVADLVIGGNSTASADFRVTGLGSGSDLAGYTYGRRFLDIDNTNYYVEPGNTVVAGLFAGNVGIGTSSPDTAFEIYNGSQAVYADNVRYYRNVAHYSTSGNPTTGTVKITMPKSWSNTMMQIRIQGYNYSSNVGAWEVIISGYNYAGSTSWVNYTAEINGSAPFTQVRLAHDGSNNVILLGDTSTNWHYPKITVTEFIAGFNNIDGWGTGWSITSIASETGITNSVTPPIRTYLTADGNVGIGTTAPTQLLDINGDIRVRGNDIADSANTNRITLGGTTTLTNTNTTLSGTTTLTASSLATFTTSATLNMTSTTALNLGNTAALTLGASATGGTLNGSSSANGNLTIQGTSSATKTTSYVNIQPSGGNVGIGTTTPLEKLDVSGDLVITKNGSEVIRFNNTDSVSTEADIFIASQGILAAETNLYMHSGSGYISFGTGGQSTSAATERMRLTADGNLGIGVTNAVGKLQIGNDEVRIGTGGTLNYASGNGDLYVQDDLEVDGTTYSTNFIQNGNQVCDDTGNCTTNGLWQNTSNVFHPRNQWAGVADLVIGGNSTGSAAFQVIGSGSNAGRVLGASFYDINNTSYFIDPSNTSGSGNFAGNIGVGTTTSNYVIDAFNSANGDAFRFYSGDGTTGERDVFTIEDNDGGGGSQDESSTLKVYRTGAFSSTDDGSSLLELTYTGGTATNDRQFYAVGRTTDEGAVTWGIDMADADIWTTGSIRGGATGTDCGGTNANCFNSQSFQIAASGDSYINGGNVGIGVSSPSQVLDVNGDVRIRGNDIADGGNNNRISLGATTTLTNTTTTLSGTTTLTASSLATMTTASTVAWGGATTLTFTSDNATINGSDAANGNLTLQGTTSGTRTTSYVNLQPNGGNVGVGLTAPAQKFTISGTSVAGTGSQTNISAYVANGMRINGSSANAQDAITYQSGLSGGATAIAFGRGGSYDTFMDFYVNSSAGNTSGSINTHAIRIDSSGNIGMGTTSPANLLSLNTTGNSSGIEFDDKLAISGYSGDNWLRLNNDSDFTSGVYTPGNLRADGEIRTSSTDYGNYKLQTDGNIYADGTITVNTLGTATSTPLCIGSGVISSCSGSFVAGSGTTNYVARWTGTSSLGTGVLYDDGTNVGVGTTSPLAIFNAMSTSEQLRLSYNAGNYASFTTSSGGDLIIAPSGGDLDITGTLDVSGRGAIGPHASISTNQVLHVEEDFSLNSHSYQIYSNPTITSPGTITSDRTAYGIYMNVTNNITEDVVSGFDTDTYGGYFSANTNGSTTFRNMYGVYGYAYNDSDSGSNLGAVYGGTFIGRNLDDTATLPNAYGVHGYVQGDTGSGVTNSITNAYGVAGRLYPYNTGISTGYAGYFSAQTNNSYNGDIGTGYGIYSQVNVDSDDGGDITTGYAGYFNTTRRSTANLMTTAYGIYVDADDATTTYALNLNATDADPTTNYGIRLNVDNASGDNYGIYGDEGDWVLDANGNGSIGGTGSGGDLALGETQNLRLYHNGSNSFIVNHTGYLAVNGNASTNNVVLQSNGGNVGIGSTGPNNILVLNTTSTTSGIELDDKLAISGYSGDNWLRLNQSGNFSNGIYTPGDFRADGEIRSGSTDYGAYDIQANGNVYFNGSITVNSLGSASSTPLCYNGSNQISSCSSSFVSGSGTTNYVARWTASDTIGTGVLYDNGTDVAIGTTVPYESKLYISENLESNNKRGLTVASTSNAVNAAVYNVKSELTHSTNMTGGNPLGLYGYHAEVTNSASNNTTSGIIDLYGIRTTATYSPTSNSNGTRNIYGGRFTAVNSASGSTSNSYGVYAEASGSNNNYGIYSASGFNYFSGNVGINTTTPSSELEINGSIMLSNSSGNIINHTAQSSYDKIRVWNSNLYTIGMASGQSYGFLNDYAMTFTMNPTANRGWLWRDSSDAASDGAMSLTTDGRLTVKSTAWFQGNVGIGTNNPRRLLEVGTGGNTPAQTYEGIYVNPGTTEAQISVESSGGIEMGMFAHSNSIGYMGTWSNNQLRFRTNNTDQMTILTNGNVGIGVTSPTQLLDVNGQGVFRVGGTGGNFAIGTPGGASGFSMSNTNRSDFRFDGSRAYLLVDAGTGAPSTLSGLNIDTNGNVGIGTTTTTSEQFVVKSTAASKSVISAIGAGLDSPHNFDFYSWASSWGPVSGGIRGGSHDSVWATQMYGNQTLDFRAGGYSAGAPHMSLISSGNIGIGTGNPTGKFQVWTSGVIKFGDTSTPGMEFQVGSGDLYLGSNTQNGDLIVRNTAGTAIVNLRASGLSGEFKGDIRVGNATTNGCVQRFDGGTLVGTCTSDERLKTDIQPITNILDRMTQITPANYTWNQLAADLYDAKTGSVNSGVIAQDIETYFPELVVYDDKGYRQVNYTAFPIYSMVAIKELNTKFEEIKLDSAGEVFLAGSNGNYTVTPVGSSTPISKILASAQVITGKVSTGLVNTKELVVQQSAQIGSLSVNTMTIAGQNIQDYIASIVRQQVNSTSPQIATGSAQIANLTTENLTTETATVSSSLTAPVALIEELTTTNLSATGTTTLGSLMAETATISGSLTAENLDISGSTRLAILEAQQAQLADVKATTAELMNATVSGTLYAENIYDLNGKIAQALQEPSIMDIITNNLPEPLPEADPVSVYDSVESAGYTINPDLLAITGSEVALADGDILLSAQAAYVEKYLQVNGLAYIAQSLGVGENLILGNTTVIDDRSIAFTPTTTEDNIFYFQPSGQGSLNFLAGLMTLEGGQVTITGSLRVAGTTQTDTLLTNLIQPADFGNPFQVQVAGASTNSAEIKKSRFEIINELGTPVATISAEGKANFAGGIGVGSENIDTPAVASGSAATVTASKSSGKAKLPANTSQLTIESDQITENSLIYVTPVGSTQNQVLYVKSQTPENTTTPEKDGKFVVGFDQAITSDVNFNWWIVN